ncbi:fluoride efflux transporter CrcB [Ruminococcus sp.]|jgi:CrcB protein|uniref:fluoride efflux transporter CrcB n=1 Tax=Ruminococcus sp. TaxID=41978 RepID=UPI0025E5B24C|nr:fluoride efflux transporter CrcB [Ruminococcus sp.]
MTDCLIVAFGGAIGAVCRFLIGKLPVGSNEGFPIKTFLINIIGCFIIGLAAALALKQLSESPKLVMFLKVGICGGFTTFSSFALETSGLIEKGSYLTAAAYVVLSVVLGVAAVFAAQFLAEKIF